MDNLAEFYFKKLIEELKTLNDSVKDIGRNTAPSKEEKPAEKKEKKK